ncbi:hypothetical protein CC86DRAFT_30743 [Ophiobolus disseminans]|uniref:Uncharacterized protein n=1 Tax=Ophiobolus disseminans TaxID=1469910 RepID=A0A6A7A050_9PLEO|nr:hypothetical protein CC86DRAFT_30743 [Ophiobolus disseminans]
MPWLLYDGDTCRMMRNKANQREDGDIEGTRFIVAVLARRGVTAGCFIHFFRQLRDDICQFAVSGLEMMRGKWVGIGKGACTWQTLAMLLTRTGMGVGSCGCARCIHPVARQRCSSTHGCCRKHWATFHVDDISATN